MYFLKYCTENDIHMNTMQQSSSPFIFDYLYHTKYFANYVQLTDYHFLFFVYFTIVLNIVSTLINFITFL